MALILMRKILENLELVLTGAGLLVIFVVHLIFRGNENSWMLSAVTAVAVGVLHGFIFWLVRRRQRTIRRRALQEAEQMLKDVVNNQLCVITFAVEMHKREEISFKTAHEHITDSVGKVHVVLNDLSEESLELWKSKYKKGLPPMDPGHAL
ncbi:MAG: hypothetical protein ABW223_13465 [Rariglobus sp.]